jgi:hypothetical protein
LVLSPVLRIKIKTNLRHKLIETDRKTKMLRKIFTIVLYGDLIGSSPINGFGTMKFVCTKRL